MPCRQAPSQRRDVRAACWSIDSFQRMSPRRGVTWAVGRIRGVRHSTEGSYCACPVRVAQLRRQRWQRAGHDYWNGLYTSDMSLLVRASACNYKPVKTTVVCTLRVFRKQPTARAAVLDAFQQMCPGAAITYLDVLFSFILFVSLYRGGRATMQ